MNGSIVTLVSSDTVDFMEQVRQAFLAVSIYHGEGRLTSVSYQTGSNVVPLGPPKEF